MLSKKKGFVLYFDSYPSIAQLSDSQQGVLFSALYRYAQAICDRPEDPITAVAKYPALDPDARMAFCFMAGNIARDTEKWKQRQARCSKAAEERGKKKDAPDWTFGGKCPPEKDPSRAWDYI